MDKYRHLIRGLALFIALKMLLYVLLKDFAGYINRSIMLSLCFVRSHDHALT